MIRVAVNGYGRIGRSVLRAVYESKLQDQIKIVAINEPADNKTIAHLTRYDSTHGRFLGEVNCDENTLTVCGDSIAIVHEDNLDQLPWSDLNVDVVLECRGSFSDRHKAEQHLQSGANRVLFSQPAESDVDATIVYGYNHHQLTGKERIISIASCSTHCVVPVIEILD